MVAVSGAKRPLRIIRRSEPPISSSPDISCTPNPPLTGRPIWRQEVLETPTSDAPETIGYKSPEPLSEDGGADLEDGRDWLAPVFRAMNALTVASIAAIVATTGFMFWQSGQDKEETSRRMRSKALEVIREARAVRNLPLDAGTMATLPSGTSFREGAMSGMVQHEPGAVSVVFDNLPAQVCDFVASQAAQSDGSRAWIYSGAAWTPVPPGGCHPFRSSTLKVTYPVITQ